MDRSDAHPWSDVDGLYRRHGAELVRLAHLTCGDPETARDAVQDAFVRIQQRPPALRDETKVLPYLRSMVLNAARSPRRRRLTERRALRRSAPGIVDAASTPDTLTDLDRTAVMTAVRALPDRQRDCVLLRYWLDLSEAEIAETLGISPGTVKSSCHRAMHHLAPVLEALR